MPSAIRRLKVAALVDLLRSPQSGGHVKGWERLARAAVTMPDLPLDLTVFFSGQPVTESLSAHVTIRQLPQVFSTARLTFLPYLPDHTDLAPWHPQLARALHDFDVIHTTDAYFAFTRTAERVARRYNKALTFSVHTDQANYARIFTAKAIRDRLGSGWLGRLLIDRLQLPERAGRKMERDFGRHVRQCFAVMVPRPIDRAMVEQFIDPARVWPMQLGIDKRMFNPERADRAAVLTRYGIPHDRLILLFVGRLDEGKNIYTLLQAMQPLVASGLALHLIAAGLGPAEEAIRQTLGDNATVAGFIPPEQMAVLYASADALALVSEVETRSMAMIESLASGLPVLVAAKPQLDRLLPPTRAVRVVIGGTAAWQQALRDFAQNAELRQTMRTAAQDVANAGIVNWEDVLSKGLLPLWQRAAAERGRLN